MAQAEQIKAPGSRRAEAIPVPAQTYRPTLAAMPELQGQRASAMVVAIEAPSLEALDFPGTGTHHSSAHSTERPLAHL